MTVREAFEKAGYPVPEGTERICNPEKRVWLCFGSKGSWVFVNAQWGTGFTPTVGNPDVYLPNIINLPAIDAYDALPDVVKAAVPK